MASDSSGGTDPTAVAPASGGDQDTVPAETHALGAHAHAPATEQLGRYKLEELIGKGGMGEVILARDEEIGRPVAIKRMRARDAAPELVSRFLREARIQGRLEHPAIVPVHELREESGEPYFVMKRLSGVTLAEVIGGGEKFTRQQLLRAFVDVCLAIEFAHTRGVVHRDLKPANIMLGDFGEVYVLDWGIARVLGDDASRAAFGDVDTLEGGATLAGTMLGTPGYMSPEQVRGDADVDAQSDVYALGCILFEILAGKPLHPRGQAALASTLAGLDARPSHAAPDRDTPPELDAACQRATTLERAARFTRARDLGDAVQRYLDGDRDLAVRRELARAELVHAREAIARGNAVDARRDAIRAAARALALDPHAREAAELVGKLMIEPPAETPPEVEADLAAKDREVMQRYARRGGLAMFAYIGFLPILYAVGIRDFDYLTPMALLVVVTMTARRIFGGRTTGAIMVLSFAANMVMVAILGRLTSPFLLAPALAMVTATVYSMVPKIGRGWLLYIGFAAAVLAPFAAELAGLVAPTVEISGNAIVLHTDAERLAPAPTLAALCLFVASVLAMAIALARDIYNARRRSDRALQVQAWQLRQLVPAR